MKQGYLNVPPGKFPTTPAHANTSAATAAKPPQAKPAASPQPISTRHRISADEKRRTQRVLLRVRANIHVALEGKERTFEVNTLSVNPHGALLVMSQKLPSETHLVLEHGGTKERIACKVTHTPRESPDGFHIPIEFDSPAPGFWRIAFPPADWRAEDV